MSQPPLNQPDDLIRPSAPPQASTGPEPSDLAQATTEPSTPAGPKRIFVLADGTWKDDISPQKGLTNVRRFRQCLNSVDERGTMTQEWIYQEGLGTADKGNKLKRLGTLLGGGGLGRGIDDNIVYLYVRLVQIYNPGDYLYFLGFSRGAYIVRCLADFVASAGILDANRYPEASRETPITELYKAWKENAKNSGPQGQQPGPRGSQPPQYTTHRQVQIDACAVWDTVSAIGLPEVHGFRFGGNPFRNVAISLHPDVRFGFQALALNEDRQNYQAMVWPTATDTQTIKQYWFFGRHSSVGGGSEQLNNICNSTLNWICSQLTALLGVGIIQHRLDILTRLPPDVVRYGIDELERPPKAAGILGRVVRNPGNPDPKNQWMHITVRLWDRFLTLNKRPDGLNLMFRGEPVNVGGTFQWTTKAGDIILEGLPNPMERINRLYQQIASEGDDSIHTLAPGRGVPHSGHSSHSNRTLPADSTEGSQNQTGGR